MSIAVVAAIILIGLLFIILEIFVIPGTTIFGFIGGVIAIAGVILAYAELGTTAGHISFAATAVSTVILLYVGFKMVQSRKYSMNEVVSGKVNTIETEKSLVKIGDSGMTHTDLRPNGKAYFDGKKIEVYSLGEYIEKDQTIEIVKISSSKIFVKPKAADEEQQT